MQFNEYDITTLGLLSSNVICVVGLHCVLLYKCVNKFKIIVEKTWTEIMVSLIYCLVSGEMK